MNISDKKLSDTEWSKRKNENTSDIAAAGIEHFYKSPKLMSSSTSSSVYITLAKESPPRDYDTDDTTYDSLNEQETDLCKDTSDTESSDYSTDHTDAIATMEVVEYEVASTSNDDNSSLADSSSGTDDFVIAAVASAFYSTNSSNEFAIFADTEESDDGAVDPEIGRADYWTCVKCKNKQNNPLYRFCEKCYQVRKSLFPPRPKCRKTRRNNKSPRMNFTGGSQHSASLSSSSNSTSSSRSGNSMLSFPSTGEIRRKIGKLINKNNCNNKNIGKNSAGESTDTDSINSDSDSNHRDDRKSSGLLSELKLKQHNRLLGKHDKNLKHYYLNDDNALEKVVNDELVAFSSTSEKMSCVSVSENSNRVLNDSLKKESTKILNLECSSSSSSNTNNNKYSSSLINRKRNLIDLANAELGEKLKDIDSVDGLSKSFDLKEIDENHLVKRIKNSDTQRIEIPNRLNLKKNDSIDSNTSSVVHKDSGISSCSSQDLSPVIDIDFIRYSSSQETFWPESEYLTGGSNQINRGKNYDSECEIIGDSQRTDNTILATALKQSISSCTDVFTSSQTSTIEPLKFIDSSDNVPIEKTFKEPEHQQLLQNTFSQESGISSVSVTDSNLGVCMFCMSEPKNGVFVHNKFLHLCCCYKCAVKVWKQRKSCPVCNCKVKNVMKIFAH